MDGDAGKAFKALQAQMVRIKNGERLPDDFVLNRRTYNDLSPERAMRLYEQKERDFVLLDVSSKSYRPEKELPEALKIPLEELGIRYKELVNKAVSVLIISEDGTRSILACEILNNRGYYNLNNISGGYKFWPAFRQSWDKDSGRDLEESA